MNKNKRYVIALIIILLFISLWGYTHIDPNPPYNEYEFWVTTVPENTITLSHFQLFYDFDSQEGKIEFKTENTQNFERTIDGRIDIKIPSSLIITGYNVTKENHMIDEFQASSIERGISFDAFGSSIERAKFVIDFQKKDKDIYPNGRFAVHTIAKFFYSKFEEGYGEARIKFKLGRYSCKEPCFYDITNTAPPRFVNDTLVFFEYESPSKAKSNVFLLRTLDGKKAIRKDALFALWTGLLVGIVFLITTWLDEYFREH